MVHQKEIVDPREFHGDTAEILAALTDILSSSSFSNADRLKNFLQYVVTEAVDGRAGTIKGKTIAQDVYGRNAAIDGDPENVVRVDARRLRRRLAEYYAGEGRDAKIRIHIDSGGYAPRFEILADPDHIPANTEISPKPPLPPPRHSETRLRSAPFLVGALTVTGLAVLIASYSIYISRAPDTTDQPSDRSSHRQALLEKSPAALKAVNMAEQARTLLVPIFDVERQKLSLGFFKEAIRLDPAYFGGYAGAARATGTLALLSPGGPQKEVLRTEARTFAAKAVELNPTDPWTQSAASWAAMANGNYAEALRLSKLAHELAPDDLHVLEIYGTVALADGDFQLALDLSQPLIASRKKLYRTGNRNVYAVANFYLGNYRETIDALKTAAELGEPVSSGMQAFKTAAYQALGETETAKKQARILMETWPVAIDEVFKRIMRDPAHPEEVGRLLRAAGWSPP